MLEQSSLDSVAQAIAHLQAAQVSNNKLVFERQILDAIDEIQNACACEGIPFSVKP